MCIRDRIWPLALRIDEHIKRLIILDISELAFDQYGNYVVQELIEQANSIELWKIMKKLCNHLDLLSTNKYGSNVLESLIEHLNLCQLPVLLDRLSSAVDVKTIGDHPYGQYVIKRLNKYLYN